MNIAQEKKLIKELKEPDQFVGFWATAAKKLSGSKAAILGGLGAVIVLALVGIGVRQMMGRRGEETSKAYGRFQRIASAALIPEKGDVPKFEDNLPHFKTDTERQQAAAKAVDEFLAAHAGSPLANEARMAKARFLLTAGQAPVALKLYEELRGKVDERLAFLVEEGIALCLEETGQIDQAMAAYQAIADRAKSQGSFFRDQALFSRARLLERKGQGAEATKAYKDLLAELPNTGLKSEINDRLALLEAK